MHLAPRGDACIDFGIGGSIFAICERHLAPTRQATETKCHGIGQCLPRRMSMTPFFLAGTAFLRTTPSELPHLAGSRTSPVRVLSLITVGWCFLPGQRATARPNEPPPIGAVATPLNSFDECLTLAPRDLHGCQEP